MTLNWVDFSIIGFLTVFSLLGFIKGFTHRVLSLLSWGGAITLTLRYFDPTRQWMSQHISSPLGSTVATSACLFLGFLIAFKLLTSKISLGIQKSPLGFIDRTLGVAFGALIGTALLLVLSIIITVFVPSLYRTEGGMKSVLMPYVLEGQNYISQLSPVQKEKKILESVQKKIEVKKESGETGYRPKERKKLDALIAGFQ